MRWFEGSIPDAINLAKQRGALFVVYIYGTDELSEQMTTTLDSSAVEQVLESNRAVALKILSTSQECKFFSQIFPVVVVPSVFCIGDQGVPLEVIGGYLSEEDCVNKLKEVQQTHSERKLSAPASPPQQQEPLVSEQHQRMEASPAGPQPSTASQPDVEMSHTPERATGGGDPDPTLTDKVERAKELIETVKEKKAREEFVKQQREEKERRNLGHALARLKQLQQDTQMKELKKDKEEEKRARVKIKAQIARDREEVASRYKKEKDEREKRTEEVKKAKEQERQRQAAEQEAQRCETARIQVRLPDGSSMTHNFDATETFQDLRSIITQTHSERKLSAPASPPQQQEPLVSEQHQRMEASPAEPQPSTASQPDVEMSHKPEGATGGGDPDPTLTDKVEREEVASRYKKEKDEREKRTEEVKKAKEQERQRQAAEQEAQRCETARIQVRLPYGFSMTHNFDATETFQALRYIITQRVGGSVSISTPYPTRSFTETDDSKTFRELQLAPSAVVMALPLRGGRSSGRVMSQDSSRGFLALLLSCWGRQSDTPAA